MTTEYKLYFFRAPNLRKKTLINYYLWFSTALIYYGLTLNSNSLGASLFAYFSIGKVREGDPLGYFLSMFIPQS